MSSTLEKIKQNKKKSKKNYFYSLSLSSYSVKYMSLKERVLKKKKKRTKATTYIGTKRTFSILF